MATITGSITDGIGSNDARVVAYGVTMSETFRLPEALAVIRAHVASVADGIGAHDAVVNALGIIVIEQLRLAQTEIPNQIGQLAIVEKIVATELIARGLPASVTDGIGVALLQAAAQAVALIEKLGIADVILGAAAYHLSVSEQISYADTLARFIGASISESMQVVESLTAVAQMPQTISEDVGVADTISPQLLLRVEAEETFEIDDAELVKMIFSGEGIVEGLQIAAAYLGPSGSVTTWAMNTRTAAVTEYTNYNFNSFAQLGDKYLGATKDGLYELSGDTDAGVDIIADIKSGFAQFAGVHLSSFKGAYIAVRGGGSYVLRIFTGDGNRYDYAVTADSMKTARINMGKGIRARYFAFELISSGQDFDLESLEFIPLVAKRRV